MILPLLAIVVPVILLGVTLMALSKWARRRNAEIKREGFASAAEAHKALAERDFSKFVTLNFLGDSSAFVQKVGRFLAVGVILFVAIFFMWFSAMFALRALQ